MRKYLYAFISCCVVQSVFAEPSGVYQNQHVSSILIPRIILQNVLIQDDLISQTPGAVEKMMAKYDKLAGPLGQEPLTVNDITQICVESGVITQKEDCLNRVFNPVLAEMGKVRFMNTCSGKITGGNNHCVDDVFVEGKKQNGNQYHQDVNVNPYAANGFAIEYAKKKGHDVWCSSEIKDATINCTTLDNKEFYSVKFKGTGNTTDSTIEKNLVQGICALFDSKYAMRTFRHQCKMDCGPGSKAREVIQKFGLTVHDGYSTDTHCEIYQPTYTAKDVKTYPGYEYMSRAFKSVQSVLDSSLVNVLETYVKLQGINVQSFNCEYSSRKYSDEMSEGGIPVSFDDMLRCRINDTEVDFIFDDLFEGKEYERKAGQAAMQCILAGGDYGSDRICSGLGKAKCLSPEVQSMVPGGTRWDDKAEVCLLNRAENARTISNALQVGGGIALAIVFTPTGMPFVALAAVGGSVALDMAFIGIERLNILEPASRARAFATDAQKCQIPIGSKHPSCSQEQVDCAWRVVNQHFARLDEILDRLNPDQLSLVSDLMENVTDCLSNDLLSSAVQTSTPNVWDKALNQADGLLLAAGIFISPENMVNRLAHSAPKVARIMSKAQMVERVSSSLDGARYVRIYVDNLSMSDIDNLVDGIQRNGFFVSSNIEDITQRQFIGFADRNVFANWNNSPNNWLFGRAMGNGAKSVSHNTGRLGRDLGNFLSASGITPYRFDDFYGVEYRTGKQVISGLKFHVSVRPNDLEKTAFIVDDLMKRTNVADLWKVELNGMVGDQLGKDFTIYVSPNGYDQGKIQSFLDELESLLRRNNISSNGFGSSIMTGDRPVPGSNYINYRYDQVNSFGIPDGKYHGRNKQGYYEFFAPNAQYGGDIMNGIRIR